MDRVVIEAKTGGAKLSLLFWLAELLLAVFFAGLGVYWLFVEEPWVGVALCFGSLILLMASVIMISASRGILALRRPAIEMGPEGFIDRRISEQIIPWGSLEWRIMFTGKSHSLVFDVDRAMAERLNPRFSARAMAVMARLFGIPAYTVMTLGTGKNEHELGELMKRFKLPIR